MHTCICACGRYLHVHPSTFNVAVLCALFLVRHGSRSRAERGRSSLGLVGVSVCLSSTTSLHARARTANHGHSSTRFSILHSSSRARHRCIAAAYHRVPLRQQRPRRTGSVTHRVSSTAASRCVPPPSAYLQIASHSFRCIPLFASDTVFVST